MSRVDQIKEQAEKLVALMKDPHEGLVTWNAMLMDRVLMINSLMGMQEIYLQPILDLRNKLADSGFNKVVVNVTDIDVAVIKICDEMGCDWPFVGLDGKHTVKP